MRIEYFTTEKFMSFFEKMKIKPEQEPEAQEQPKYNRENIPRVPPEQIIIDGSNWIKEVTDNKDIPEGKVDILTPFGWQPFTPGPEVEEIKK